MDNALNEKLDLSALHLGIISVGALLGAVVTDYQCLRRQLYPELRHDAPIRRLAHRAPLGQKPVRP